MIMPSPFAQDAWIPPQLQASVQASAGPYPSTNWGGAAAGTQPKPQSARTGTIRYAEHTPVARELGELKLSPVNLEITRSKFDLSVFVAEQEDDAAGYWLYSTELFE